MYECVVCVYVRVHECTCMCSYPNTVADTAAALLDVEDVEPQLHAVENVSHERPPTVDAVGVVSREVG